VVTSGGAAFGAAVSSLFAQYLTRLSAFSIGDLTGGIQVGVASGALTPAGAVDALAVLAAGIPTQNVF
jgi:hypothetical protein